MKELIVLMTFIFAGIVVNSQPQAGVDHGFMGVGVENLKPEQVQRLKLKDDKGVIIIDVVDNSSAKDAGLKIDDVIIKVKDVPVINIEQFMKERLKYVAGEVIQITYIRNGQPFTKVMKLKPVPKTAP